MEPQIKKFRAWDGVKYHYRIIPSFHGLTPAIFMHGEFQNVTSIEQFIGITDADGTDIYEKDILTFGIKGVEGLIGWSASYCSCVIQVLKPFIYVYKIDEVDRSKLKVIGNSNERRTGS